MCVVCYVCVCMCRHVHMCIEARGQCQVSSMIAFHPISLDKVLLNLEFIAFLGLAHLVLGICMSAPIQHWMKDSHKGTSLLGRSPWSELRYSWLWGSTSSNRAIFQVLQEIILNSTYAVVIFLTWQVSGYNLFENVTKMQCQCPMMTNLKHTMKRLAVAGTQIYGLIHCIPFCYWKLVDMG